MPISDEKVEELLSTMKTMMEGMNQQSEQMRRMQDEHSKMTGKMFAIFEAQQHRMQQDQTPHDSSINIKEEDGELPNSRSKAPRPTRPTMEADVDDVEWRIFLDKWRHYKKIAKLTSDAEICLELREACSDQVNKLLYEFVGPEELSDEELTEVALLKHIKSVAVKSIHKEVHRWHFSQLTQHDGETATNYIGRLKSQAVLCEYRVVCGCGCNKEVSFAEEMIAQQLVAGLVNPEHQSRIMSEAHDLQNLQSKVERLIALETTDDATSKIRATPSQASAGKFSLYKKEQRAKTNPDDRPRRTQRGRNYQRRSSMQRQSRCRGCGRSSHRDGKDLSRENCPAFGKECDECGMKNHFAKVCRRRRSRSNFAGTDDESSFSEAETEMSEEEYSEYDENQDREEEHSEGRLFATKAQDFRSRPKRGTRR